MDIENFYTEQGEGFPLILLHGNGEDSTYFVHQTEEFSKYYRVYALDTRGHGKTPRGDKPFTLNQFTEDLLEFMNKKEIKKAHILGFSDGGNIALLFALQYSERIEKLVLNGANLFPSGMTLLTRLSVVLEYKFTCLFDNGNKLKKEMLELMINEPDIKPEELNSILNKTLVIAGFRDMIKKKHTELIAENMSNSELIFIKGNHFIAKNNSKDFNMVVLKFLKDG